MPTIPYTQKLSNEYVRLFNECVVRPGRASSLATIVTTILAKRATYQAVGLGIPWYFIGAIHNLEASLNFTKHLHNGDPLTARTTRVPAGRPKTGAPPFTWPESAADALTMKGLHNLKDWSLGRTLYELERYNGFGYRLYHPHVLSPYLWSFSTHYVSGKYVADGTWSDTAVSAQCGAAVTLRRLAELGEVDFPDQPLPAAGAPPLVVPYAVKKPTSSAAIAAALTLQRWLNTHPGIFVKEDGHAGSGTSAAWRLVTGHYLPGDPRA